METIINSELNYIALTAKIADSKFPTNIRSYIHQIAKTLKINQWITIQKKRLTSNSIIIDNLYESQSTKPSGLYFSKGDGLFKKSLFKENSNVYDYNIIIAEIDISNMLLITTDNEFEKMYDKFVGKWQTFRNYYDGLIAIPNIGIFNTFGVSRLITWKFSTIKNSIIIGKFGDFISKYDIDNGNMDKIENGLKKLLISIKNNSHALNLITKYKKMKSK